MSVLLIWFVSEKNDQLTFGAYDEFGRKNKVQERAIDVDYIPYFSNTPKKDYIHDSTKDDLMLNITIDMNEIEKRENTEKFEDFETELLERVDTVFLKNWKICTQNLQHCDN